MIHKPINGAVTGDDAEIISYNTDLNTNQTSTTTATASTVDDTSLDGGQYESRRWTIRVSTVDDTSFDSARNQWRLYKQWPDALRLVPLTAQLIFTACQALPTI
jgi:hypothetical protein